MRKADSYRWCKHCERVWTAQDWIHHDGCPSRSCKAWVMDYLTWSDVLVIVEDYPLRPVIGRSYPLCGGFGF